MKLSRQRAVWRRRMRGVGAAPLLAGLVSVGTAMALVGAVLLNGVRG